MGHQMQGNGNTLKYNNYSNVPYNGIHYGCDYVTNNSSPTVNPTPSTISNNTINYGCYRSNDGAAIYQDCNYAACNTVFANNTINYLTQGRIDTSGPIDHDTNFNRWAFYSDGISVGFYSNNICNECTNGYFLNSQVGSTLTGAIMNLSSGDMAPWGVGSTSAGPGPTIGSGNYYTTNGTFYPYYASRAASVSGQIYHGGTGVYNEGGGQNYTQAQYNALHANVS